MNAEQIRSVVNSALTCETKSDAKTFLDQAMAGMEIANRAADFPFADFVELEDAINAAAAQLGFVIDESTGSISDAPEVESAWEAAYETQAEKDIDAEYARARR